MIKSQIATTSDLQEGLLRTVANADETQMRRLDDIDKGVQSSHKAVTTALSDIERFHDRFRIVEGHLIEVKAMLHLQQEIPQRVLHEKIISVIDPFETHQLTIPLETIDSFEALLAVFSVRFKEKGEAALDVLRQNFSVMYDHASHRQIDMSLPWSRAFKV